MEIENQSIIEFLQVLEEYSTKIKEDLHQLNGYKITTIQECLSPTLFEEFKTVELTQETQKELQTSTIELKTLLQQFMNITINGDSEQSSQIHTQILYVLQKIVGLLNDDISQVDDQLQQLQDVSIEQKIVDLTLLDLENM